MTVWCQICRKTAACDLSVQLIPCLHTFCLACLNDYSKSSKICPSSHCYSPIQVPELYINICEGERCVKKIALNAEVLRTPCQHDICQYCYDQASRRDKILCPAPGCAEPLTEDDENVCDGCKLPLVADKSVVLPCCLSRMCRDCAKKTTNGKETCEPGKCVFRERGGKKKKVAETTKSTCMSQPGCEGEVLRNFPSEGECEHEVCLGCVAKMVDGCAQSGKPPNCPNKGCQLPYRCESVLALRALFPEKKSYFAKFALDVHFSMQALKDEAIMHIDATNAPSSVQHFQIKTCQCEDEENTLTLDFIRSGTLGDLIREIRRVLRIMATDKIYGYYRRDDKDEKKLEVSQKTIHSTMDQLNIREVPFLLH
ncbi:unnamed protein product [Caenorhabditis auriculariae]|uniref:RING-type domain-containing protein n=1 Tax=Caenorhabditis auriculariae TaxID=2777116 RepID=A0A8S1HEB4_9PELO|nr:unnamed protein product [Caenorhabditis auriculariae]